MSARDEAAEVLITHQRIPMFDGTVGSRCAGCDHLRGESDGPNSPRHARHLADALAEAGLLRDEHAEQALARVEALAYSPQADTFRNEASRHVVEQPYADNRYVRLLDDLRAALRGDR